MSLLLAAPGLAAVDAASPIRFVGNQDYPPLEFLENGTAKGLFVDILHALSQASGRRIDLSLMPWEQAQQQVARGEADALGLLAITEERKKLFDFTDPVLDLEYSLFVRRDQTAISGLEDLQGRTVGVIAGGFSMQLLERSRLGVRLVAVPTHEEGLHQVENGTLQAFAGDKWVSFYHLQQEGIHNVKAIVPSFATREAAFAVRKGNLRLLQELNLGLLQIKRQGVLQEIIEKWSGKQVVVLTQESLVHTIAIVSSVALLILILLLIVWIYNLKLQAAERKQAEHSLKESEYRFRNIFDNSPVAIGIGEATGGKLIEVNDAWLKLYGYERSEVIGRTAAELGLYVDNRERDEVINLIKEQGKIVNRLTRLRRKTGEVLDTLYFAEIYTYNSQPYLQVMITDITEKTRAEALLNRRSTEMYNLFNNSQVAMFRSRVDGSEIIDVNEKFLEIAGRTRAEVVGKPALGLWAFPEQRAEILRRLRNAGRVVDSEVTLLDRDGNQRECLASLSLFADEGMVDGSFIDVTERKRAEASLLRSEALYREFVEGTSDLVTRVDAEGRFLFVNRNGERYFGCPASDCLGRSSFDFVHPDDRAKTLAAFQQWMSTGVTSTTFENRQVSLSGEVHDLLWTINLTYGEHGVKQLNSIARDVTEQRKLQNEQIRTQKLESLGVLAGGIAHDFNNILTGIVGSISLARMSLSPSPRASVLLGQAEEACKRAADLAQQLLTFAKGSQPIKKLVAVRRILEASASLVLRGSNTQSVLEVAEGLRDLEADEGQLSQVFNNIIINASQAMPGGGVVTIVAGNTTLDAVNEHALPPGEYVRLSFTDRGCGISEENLKRIFDPYFTTKVAGNGLGLASVHSIIVKHGGHIGVQSREGEGTTFVILLPASSQRVPQEEDLPVPAVKRKESSQGPILVVDDEEMIRELASAMLQQLGYQVQTCSSGEQAIALYHAALAAEVPFAAVIMDLTIPGGMGGQEAARQILRLDPDAFLIVSSGYSNDPVMSDFARFGFRQTLVKPYNITALTQVMGKLPLE